MPRTIGVMFDGSVFRPLQPLTLLPNRAYEITIQDDEVKHAAKVSPVERSDPSATDNGLISAAWRIYNDRLKSILEPDYLGREVAIHPESGDYEVASSSSAARRALRKRHPVGLIVVIHVGVVPDDNSLSLRARNAMRGRRL